MDMFEKQFEELKKKEAPLAARMRPNTLKEFVGQEHIVGEGRVLRKAIESGQLPSIILWGPPGSGKTTLAFIIANTTASHFSSVSAVTAGVADLRRIIEEARERRKLYQTKTILFIDEIHRFNKSQQDAVLPFVEDGTITLIGATTENPSFEVISPLLSRARVFTLNPLTEDEIKIIIQRALQDKEKGSGNIKVEIEDDALRQLITVSNSDARIALNALELAAMTTLPDAEGLRHVTLPVIEDALQHRALLYDRAGEQHYDLISALHKSLRDSDPDASLYWLARMLARTISLLRQAGINMVWVTFSNGFSIQTEQAHQEQVRRYIEACHRQGIHVMANESIANMFWEDMFERVPESHNWLQIGGDGKPVPYGAG